MIAGTKSLHEMSLGGLTVVLVGSMAATPGRSSRPLRCTPSGHQSHKAPADDRWSASGASRRVMNEMQDSVFNNLPLLLPVPQAAELLGVSRAAAYRLAASGELPTRRLGGRVYIVTSGLRDLVALHGESA